MNTKIKAVLAFSMIFIMGFASGYMFHNADPVAGNTVIDRPAENDDNGNRHERAFLRDRPERSSSEIRELRNRFADHLDLSDPQHEPFFQLIHEYRSNIRSEIREKRREEQELIRMYYDDFRNNVSEILNEEQLKHLDSHIHPDSTRHHSSRDRIPDKE